MTEGTRQRLRMVFLTGLLVGTVAGVGLFAAQRRERITALGEPITVTSLGFSVSMPKGWEPRAVGRTPFGTGLIYKRPSDPKASLDRLTRRQPQRYVLFFAMPVGASHDHILTPLAKLAVYWDANHSDFDYPDLGRLGPPRLDSLGYERREGAAKFVHQEYRIRFELIRYQQIKTPNQVFWCVIGGDTMLGADDKALLLAVSRSFRLLSDSI